MRKTTMIGMLFLMIASFGIWGCSYTDSSKQESASGAIQATPTKVPTNYKGRTSEQENIDGKNQVTTSLTKVMWIHLIALDGKIIRRMPVRNKITSSGKRLEARHFTSNPGSGSTPPKSNGVYTDEIIQPDGTFGESDAYVYWFDPMGRYHQYGTAGGIGYLLTDYPIDLQNPTDELTGLYNASKAASEWQKIQEEELKKNELKNKEKK